VKWLEENYYYKCELYFYYEFWLLILKLRVKVKVQLSLFVPLRHSAIETYICI